MEMYFLTAVNAKIQDQNVGRIGFPKVLSPWLVDGPPLPASSRGLPSVHVCGLTPSSYDPSHTGF